LQEGQQAVYETVGDSPENHSAELEQKDYIDQYEPDPVDLPPPPQEHQYEFDRASSASSVSDKDELAANEPPSPKPLGSMAEEVAKGIEDLKTTDVGCVCYLYGAILTFFKEISPFIKCGSLS